MEVAIHGVKGRRELVVKDVLARIDVKGFLHRTACSLCEDQYIEPYQLR